MKGLSEAAEIKENKCVCSTWIKQSYGVCTLIDSSMAV